MTGIPASKPIFLYTASVDMRKGFDGLSGLVENAFPDTLMTGALFIFLNRRRTVIKILVWDEDGFVIWHKRLEQGTFAHHFGEQTRLTRRELTMLLEGIVPLKMYKRFS